MLRRCAGLRSQLLDKQIYCVIGHAGRYNLAEILLFLLGERLLLYLGIYLKLLFVFLKYTSSHNCLIYGLKYFTYDSHI